jgi:hypothetical protein
MQTIRTATQLSRRTLRLAAIVLGASAALAAQQLQTPAASAPQEQTKSAPAAEAAPAVKPKLSLEEMAARLPQRVTSKDGKPGDMINFLLIGTRENVQAALKEAGWVPVDRNVEDAITHALNDVLAHRAYEHMPMSQLFLFGRPQDFGYAQGIPLKIMQTRDHFRLWEAPWLSKDGQPVWVGAGTHDLDFERDSGGQLTHAIDPHVDQEREYIAQSLEEAGAVKQKEYLTPKDPLREGLTATGDRFVSDGRVLAIFLK